MLDLLAADTASVAQKTEPREGRAAAIDFRIRDVGGRGGCGAASG